MIKYLRSYDSILAAVDFPFDIKGSGEDSVPFVHVIWDVNTEYVHDFQKITWWREQEITV